MKILCQTLFDCSYTGTTGHFRVGHVPYQDEQGQTITNITDWNRSRNQQRNYETILQMISLRAQPEILSRPQCQENLWQFEFAVETAGVYSNDGTADSTAQLLTECAGTPMITGLNEQSGIEPCLIVQGNDQNIWFKTVNSLL